MIRQSGIESRDQAEAKWLASPLALWSFPDSRIKGKQQQFIIKSWRINLRFIAQKTSLKTILVRLIVLCLIHRVVCLVFSQWIDSKQGARNASVYVFCFHLGHSRHAKMMTVLVLFMAIFTNQFFQPLRPRHHKWQHATLFYYLVVGDAAFTAVSDQCYLWSRSEHSLWTILGDNIMLFRRNRQSG